MPEFDKEFAEAQGKGIQYKGLHLIRHDKVKVNGKFRVTVNMISKNSEWRQGIELKIKNGSLTSKRSGLTGKNFILWEELFENGQQSEFTGKSKDNILLVWNSWDHGDGVIQSWLRGAAMIREKVDDNHYIYKCNDGHPDDNFDDLVFEIFIENL